MASQDDVRRIALGLPGATESDDPFSFRVAGKLFVWLWPERVDPRKPRVPNPGVIVVRVADLATKDELLAAEPDALFTTDHYAGYRAVLVRLSRVDDEELAELVTESWRCQAPASLVKRFDGAPTRPKPSRSPVGERDGPESIG